MRNEQVSQANAEVGARVSELRRARGLTQKAFAEAIGVAQPGVVLREQGRTPWTIDDLMAAAELLACSPADLLPTSPAPRPSLDLSPDEVALVYAARRGSMLEASKVLIRLLSP